MANTSLLNIKWRFCLVLNTCGHFQHLRSQFFTLYRPFASLGVNAFGCFVGKIHLNQNEYCYSMFFVKFKNASIFVCEIAKRLIY